MVRGITRPESAASMLILVILIMVRLVRQQAYQNKFCLEQLVGHNQDLATVKQVMDTGMTLHLLVDDPNDQAWIKAGIEYAKTTGF